MDTPHIDLADALISGEFFIGAPVKYVNTSMRAEVIGKSHWGGRDWLDIRLENGIIIRDLIPELFEIVADAS
jgi:hypothetical protein